MVDRVDAGGGQHLPPGRDDRGRGRFQRSRWRCVGSPVINLAFGDNSSNLAGQVGVYLRGSGTSRLVFGYRVAPGIRDTTGFQFSDRPIELRGGSIRAVSDNGSTWC